MKTVTVKDAIAMLSEISVDKDGCAGTWKLINVWNNTVYYVLERGNKWLATIYLNTGGLKPYLRELYSLNDFIHEGATFDIYCDKFGVDINIPNKYIVIKDEPFTREQFLDKYGKKPMMFHSIDDLYITYHNTSYCYKVKIEIGRHNEFKPQETANSLFKIADAGFFEFTFD